MNRRIPKQAVVFPYSPNSHPTLFQPSYPTHFSLSHHLLTNSLNSFLNTLPFLPYSLSHPTLSSNTLTSHFSPIFSHRTDYYNPLSYHTHSPHFDFPLNLSLTQISHPSHSSIFTHNFLSHHNISPVHTTLSLIPLVYSHFSEGRMW